MSNINIILLASLAGLATLIGVIFGSFFRKTNKNIIFSASFSAGLMILISVFELIPTALKNADIKSSIFWVFSGVVIIWLANKFIPHLHSIKEIKSCKDKCLMRMSYLVAIGIVLHDFPEGFTIPSSFSYSDSLGWAVVLAIFFHNIPEGYILTMSQSKSNNNNFSLKASFYSVLATFSGAILGIGLLAKFESLDSVFLSLAAGAMLFIALHELLPESFRYNDLKTFFRGISTAVFLYLAIGLI